MHASNKYRTGLICAIASVLLVSLAQLAMKYGMAHVDIDIFRALHSPSAALAQLFMLSPRMVLLPVGLGIFCYGISVLSWMAALGRLPLSFAYPLLSLSYPLVYLGAALLPFFHESLNTQRLGGIGLIMLGVTLLMVKGRQGHAA